MQYRLIPTKTIAACAFALIFMKISGHTQAQVYILQGEKGDPGHALDCAEGDCTLTGNLIVTGDISGANGSFSGDLDVGGHGVFDTLTVETSYWLPECPQGYERDTQISAYILCKKVVGVSRYDEMVKVGDFWIDKYEMSAWPNADCTGDQYGESEDDWLIPDNGGWSVKAYACSVAGITPSAYMTWFQAQQSCEAAGKSLCTNAQWQAAAAGTKDPGETGSGTKCWLSDTSTSPRATGNAGTSPGGDNSCVSMWGADDMIGNLWEWTAMWQGHPGYNGSASLMSSSYGQDGYWAGGTSYLTMPAHGSSGSWRPYSPGGIDGDGINIADFYGPAAVLRGGSWGNGSEAGVFAMALHCGPSYSVNSVGSRCCRTK